MPLHRVANGTSDMDQSDVDQFVDLFTGAMTDQPVTLSPLAAHGLMVPLAPQQVLAAAAAEVDWFSIPQTFKHLLVIHRCHTDAAVQSADIRMWINGINTGTNYGDTTMDTGDGAVNAAGNANWSTNLNESTWVWGGGRAAGSIITGPGRALIWLPDYSANSYKGYLTHTVFGDWGTLGMKLRAGGSGLNAAINRLTLAPSTGNFMAGSTFNLYGLP